MKTRADEKKFNYIYILIIAPIIFLFSYLFHIKDKIKIDDKWIPVNQIKTDQLLDTTYLYCNYYENIQNQKFINILSILIIGIIIVGLIVLVVFLLEKNKEEKYKTNDMLSKFKELNKKEKNNEIVSKFIDNDINLNINKILINEYKDIIYNMFCKLQIDSMNFDYDELENLLSDDLYYKYCMHLELQKKQFRKNIIDDIKLIDIKFIEIKEDLEKYFINIEIKI